MQEVAHLGAAVDVAEEGPLFEAGAEGQQAAADVFSEPPVDEEIEAPAKRQDAAQSDIEAAAEPGPSAVEDAPDVPLDDSLELVLEPVPEKPAAGDEDTRPLQAVPAQAGVDQDTEEIVLESELVKLESPGGDAQTPVDTAAAAPESVAKRRQPSVFGGKRLLLLGGVLVVLAGVAAGGLYFFGGAEAPGSGVKQQAQAQVDSKQAVTERRLESLGRSVRAWMKFYGSGDPAQVTLDRMQQDLGLAEAEMQDAWGTAIRYQPGSPSYTMLSAGPDRKFSTADDLKLALKVE